MNYEDDEMAGGAEEFEDDDEELEMPFGANEENKKLFLEVKQLERQVIEIEANVESNNARVAAMQDHIKNVQQEEKMIESVAAARKRETDSEAHMQRLARREADKLEREAAAAKQAIAQLADAQNKYQNDIFRFTAEVDDLKQQMHWDEGALNEWIDKARQKEEDTDTLNKYKNEDEARVKELTLQIEKLTTESQNAKRVLDQEVMNTQENEMGIDKIAEIYKQVHTERANLIKQWESTMTQMKNEDDEIDNAADDYQKLKTETKKYEMELKEQTDFLQQENQANTEAELNCEKLERNLRRTEQKRIEADAQLQRFHSELESLRSVYQRVTNDEQAKQKELVSLQAAFELKLKNQKDLEETVLELDAKIGSAHKQTLSQEEETKALEIQVEQAEGYVETLNRALVTQSQLLTEQSQKVHKHQQRKAFLESEISATEQEDKNIASRIRMLERDAVKEQQIVYRQDFHTTVLERKLMRMKGAVSDDERRKMDKELDALTETLKEHNATKSLLTTQLRKVEDDTRLAKRQHEKLKTTCAYIEDKLSDTELYNKGAKKELDQLVSKKQNLMVDENLLKLEVQRLRRRLNAKADDVLSLEQRKAQLKTAMEERMHEISVHKELLSTQKHDIMRERSAVFKEHEERRSRIGQLRKKYEIVAFSLKGPEGEEDHSHAYLLVKKAQEREELQQQGDDLDKKIRKREKEIRMLDNTMQLMTGHNQKWRQSLRRADAEDDDVAAKEHLERQLRTTLDKYKHKRRELRLQQEQLDLVQQDLARNAADIDTTNASLSSLVGETQNLQRELDDQEAKKERARRQAAKLAAAFRQGSSGESVPEKDFKLKHMQQDLAKSMDQVDQVLEVNPDLKPLVSLAYSNAGIKRPIRPTSSRGSSIASRSSMSSRSTVRSSRTTSRAGTGSRTKPSTSQEAAASSRSGVVTPKTVQLTLGGFGGRR
eukprot:m.178126 g.178126  ORF g.178126 m.178126 type:complete len:946 (-) comp31925_c1_seq1:27-2864(-)